MASKLASQMVEDDWAAQRHSMPLLTELAVLTVEADGNAEGEAADANAQGAAQNNVTVDWNSVEISARSDLVIAPMSDIEMAKLFGIHIDDGDKEESDEAANDGDTIQEKSWQI